MIDVMGLLDQYIKPEMVILIPVLYIINSIMEKTQLKEIHIPYILGSVSIILCLVYTLSTVSPYTIPTVLLAIFTSVTQGILLVGASMYINIVAVKIPKSCRNCEISENESDVKEDNQV